MNTHPTADVTVEQGAECLLNVIGRHFKVKVLEAGPDTFRVSFPGKDYPVEGMGAVIELHDEKGFYYLRTKVLEGPEVKGEGILLQRTGEIRRHLHRDRVRVPTDLIVQVKEQIHVRKYNADVINLSVGGAQIRTDAPFDFSSIVELTLSLPGEPACTALGQVVHAAEDDQPRPNGPHRFLGVRFIDLDPDAERSIARYIGQRLRELYP